MRGDPLSGPAAIAIPAQVSLPPGPASSLRRHPPHPPTAFSAGFHAPREGRAPDDERAGAESEGSRAGAPDPCPRARLLATIPRTGPVCRKGAELGSVRTPGTRRRRGRGASVLRPPSCASTVGRAPGHCGRRRPWEGGQGSRGLPWARPRPPREEKQGKPRRPAAPSGGGAQGTRRSGHRARPVSGRAGHTLPGARGQRPGTSRRPPAPSPGECGGPRPLAPLGVSAGPLRSCAPRPRRSRAP